jgi:hypothetical protein
MVCAFVIGLRSVSPEKCKRLKLYKAIGRFNRYSDPINRYASQHKPLCKIMTRLGVLLQHYPVEEAYWDGCVARGQIANGI